MHGNNKTEEELQYAVERGVGTIVLDSFDEIERLQRIAPRQRVMLRVTPGIKPVDALVHPDRPGRLEVRLRDRRRAAGARGGSATSSCAGLHAHIGSQIFELEPFEKLAEVLGALGDWPRLNLGGGLGIAYTADDEPPSIDDFADALLRRAPKDVTVLCEPGRALVGNAGVTIYTVGTVKEIPGIRTYVAVDGGMSDNLRPMLYGARYEAEIADRFGGDNLCTVAGMHCESSDILVRDVMLDDPKPGDVLVIPATGAYGHAMANNYNSLRRPPVIFCKDGDARVVVRRETFDDLTARDVALGSGSSATGRSEGRSTSFSKGGRTRSRPPPGCGPRSPAC